jgi:hypothetical protein
MQTVRITFFASILLLALLGFIILTIAIWPHLPLIGTVASWVLVDVLLCIGALIPLLAFFFLRWMWFHSSVVRRGEVVVLFQGGTQRHLSAEQESAKLLPAPVIVTEEQAYDEELERSKILHLRAKGRSLREIERELDIPYNRIQKVCAQAVNLVIEK